jgi:hypothetical protein
LIFARVSAVRSAWERRSRRGVGSRSRSRMADPG